MANVLVVAEIIDKNLRKTTLSAITFAKQVASSSGGTFDIIAIGENAQACAQSAAGFGASKVFHAEVSGGYLAERYVPTLCEIASKYQVVVATASTYGKDLLPRIAARLSAGYAGDVSAVNVDGNKIVYRRPMYAGNVSGSLELTSAVQVISVRQSEFEAAQPAGGSSALESLTVKQDAIADKIQFLGLESVKSARPELAEAQIVVSGGRALKSAENFKTVLEPLVDALGAAMGASRAACDAGYVPNDLQVGQTGKVVAPKLYVAIGISGAIQHIAGMKSSKTIVAINKDKEAPITQIADYVWVSDLFDAVPALTAEVKKLKASQA